MGTAEKTAALRRQMTHTQSSGQMDPGWERYMAGKESAARGVPLEAPPISPDDLLGTGLLAKAGLLIGALKSAGKKAVSSVAPRAEAMRLAQQRAALPVEQHGLGLPPDNTPQMRADAMFPDDVYHGSLHDIKSVNIGRSNPQGYAGSGFYTTPSPKDASINYASVNGPDIAARISNAIEEASDYGGKDYRRIWDRMSEGTLSPGRAEAVVKATGTGDNLGVVYPLRINKGKQANAVNSDLSHEVGPAEVYDDALDEYTLAPDFAKWQNARSTLEDMNVDPSPYLDEAALEGATLGGLWQNLRIRGPEAYDDMTGEMLSPGGVASAVVKALGADSVTHPTMWPNQQLNIGRQHTIMLNPDNVRSRFAAFDPWRRNAAVAASMGVAAPDLLAEELRKNQNGR